MGGVGNGVGNGCEAPGGGMLAAFFSASYTIFMSGLWSGSSTRQSFISASISGGHSAGTTTSLFDFVGSSPVTISHKTTPKLQHR